MKSTYIAPVPVDGSPLANAPLSSTSSVATKGAESQMIPNDAVVMLDGAPINSNGLNLLRNILNAVNVEAADSPKPDFALDEPLTTQDKERFSHLLSIVSRLLPEAGDAAQSGASEIPAQESAPVAIWREEAIIHHVQCGLALLDKDRTAVGRCLNREASAFKRQVQKLVLDAQAMCADMVVEADEFVDSCQSILATVEDARDWALENLWEVRSLEQLVDEFRNIFWASRSVMFDEASQLLKEARIGVKSEQKGIQRFAEVLEPFLKEKNAALDRAIIEAAAFNAIPEIDDYRKKDFDAVVETVSNLVRERGGEPCRVGDSKYRTLLKNLASQEQLRYKLEHKAHRDEFDALKEQYKDVVPVALLEQILKSKAPEPALFQKQDEAGKWILDRKEFEIVVRKAVGLILGDDQLREIADQILTKYASEKLRA